MSSSLRKCITSLPLEIMANIFIIAGAESMSHDEGSLRMRKLSLCLESLRLVCRLWNNIAVSTPHIWAEINIYVASEDAPESLSPTVLSLWLDRSADLPLRLAFTLTRLSAPDMNPVLPDILTILFRSAPRWESACFRICYEDTVHFYTRLPSLSNTCLKEFSVCGFIRRSRLETGIDQMMAEVIASCLCTLPPSCSLDISYVDTIFAHGLIQDSMKHVLNNLTKLRMECYVGCWQEAWEICRHCTSATSITLMEGSITTGEDHTDSPMRMYDLPELHFFDLYIKLPTSMTFSPLHSMWAPRLSVLSIATHFFPSIPLSKQIIPCIYKFGCTLQALRLEPIHLDELDELFMNPAVTRIPTVELQVPLENHSEREVTEVANAWGDRLGKEICLVEDLLSVRESINVGWFDLTAMPPKLEQYLPCIFRILPYDNSSYPGS